MTRSISRARMLAFQRQQGRCCYCGMPMWLKTPDELTSRFAVTVRQAQILQCTAEHIHARCDGGGNAASNIAGSCRYCNHGRHARKIAPTHEGYRNMVRARVLQRRWHCESLLALLPPAKLRGTNPR